MEVFKTEKQQNNISVETSNFAVATFLIEPCWTTDESLYFYSNNKITYHYEKNQQDALYRLIYYSKSALHVSGDVFAHHKEHWTVFTVSGSVHPGCCRHQPAATWVNTTRYCKYSQVLLMMGENIARNT